MCLWLVLWSIGAKAVDASLLSFALMLGVAAVLAYLPIVKRVVNREDE